MTVSSSASRNQYTATAGQTVFAYTFEIVSDDDIVVLKNGVTLTKTADYTVSGVGTDSGGNVTLTSGATAGDILTLYRDMPYERTTDYTNAGDFLAADVNNDFDRLWIATQQVNEEVNRSIKAPVTDPLTIDMTIPAKADRLGNYLRFNATTGNPEVGNVTGLYTAAGLNVYNFTGDGSDTTFTLGIDPGVENNTQVYIDGVYQQKNTYSVTGKVITFSAAPPNLSTIEVMVTQPMAVGETTASSVSFVQDGASTERTVQLKLQESVSVKDFGAVGDGVTDDTAAIQAAIDYATLNGTELYFPGALYRTTSELFIDRSFNSVDPTQGGRYGITLRGDGAAASIISSDHSGNCIRFLGGPSAGWHTYFMIDGLCLAHADNARPSGSVGLYIDQAAYVQVRDFDLSWFEYGLYCVDTLTSNFSDGSIRLNEYGLKFQKGTRTHPNNISFRGVAILNNQTYGGHLVEPGLFSFFGGSIESNGFTGILADPNSWGLRVEDAGAESSVGVNMHGVYIENNNGKADVWVSQATNQAIHNFSGCSFLRFSNTRYVTNCILFNATNDSRLTVSGCGFKDYAPYVSDNARLFIGAGNAQVFDGGSNFFFDTGGGYTGVSRATFAPLGINHQTQFSALPDATEYRNGIQFCSDGTGSSLPALAISDGTDWFQMPIGQFSGRVASAGSALKLPRGFSCSRTSTGVYVITHNLGLAANTYSVVGTPSGTPGTGYCSGMALSGNTFEIYFANTSGALADMDFNFNMQII